MKSLGSDSTIPDCFSFSFTDMSKQIKINMEIVKKEITDHVDEELSRFKKEIQKLKETL